MKEKVGTATQYWLRVEALGHTTACPVLTSDSASLLMAMEWAATLVRYSGFPVKVYRNSTELIEVPAK